MLDQEGAAGRKGVFMIDASKGYSQDGNKNRLRAQDIHALKAEVAHFTRARDEVKLASGDSIDLKAYEPAMRHLIDKYIGAQESEKLSTFDEFSLIQLIVERGPDAAVERLPKDLQKSETAVAETIESD